MNLNRFTLIGRVTQDIELRTTTGGTSVANINLATNNVYVDKNNGQKVEKSEFHRLIAWGKTADILKQYVVKGQEMFFEGRISYSQYEKDGVKHYRTDLTVTDFGFGAKPTGATRASTSQKSAPQGNNYDNRTEDVDTSFDRPTSIGTEDINVEDIPF